MAASVVGPERSLPWERPSCREPSCQEWGGPGRLGTVTLAPSHDDILRDALENQFGLADTVVDPASLANSVARFREQGIVLPTFAQLADPSGIDPALTAGVDKNAPDPRNLWRVHWYNDLAGNRVSVPDHIVLPKALTGVDSPIIVAFVLIITMVAASAIIAQLRALAMIIITIRIRTFIYAMYYMVSWTFPCLI